jgi:hypothetical protein
MFNRILISLGLSLMLVLSPLAATQKWVAGALTGYSTTVCGAELNSLANGDSVLCGTAVTTNTDLYGTASFTFGSVTTMGGSPYVQLAIYQLNQDGSTYGDGTFASAAAGSPAAQYLVNCIIPAPASATAAFKGECGPFPLPPGTFKFVLYDNLNTTGNAASSGNAVYLNTWNFQIN